MPTVGRKYNGPTRNWLDKCDFCDVVYPRHRLILDDDGFLRCPDDAEGRSMQALSAGAAAGAADATTVRGKTRER